MFYSFSFTSRQFSRLSLALFLVLALASCGGGAAPNAGNSPEPTEPSISVDPNLAQLCDPANPDLAEVQGIVQLESSEYGAGFVSYRGSYANKNGQQFQLTASSLPNPDSTQVDYANTFLQSLKVCFEALEDLKSAEQLIIERPEVNFEEERTARADILAAQFMNVDVLMEWISQDNELGSKNAWVTHFYIDPTIDADDGVDGFRAKCNYSASVQPDLTNKSLINNSASVTASLYKASNRLGSTTANASTRLPPKVSDANRVNNVLRLTTYDAKVTGTKNQSYNLYGSWTENNSVISSNACS